MRRSSTGTRRPKISPLTVTLSEYRLSRAHLPNSLEGPQLAYADCYDCSSEATIGD